VRAGAPLALAVALAVAGISGCRGGSGGAGAPAPVDEERGRFPHARHAEIACTDCHPVEDVLAGRPARPGAADHAPCDQSGCHRVEFLVKPGALCRMCHEAVAPGTDGGTRPAPYPPRQGRRALAAEFSHASHLDLARMEDRVGFHVSCSDCHAPEGEGLVPPGQAEGEGLVPPGHAVCGRCHAPESSAPGALDMTRCEECHRERSRQPSRIRTFITGDLRFDHASHRQDRRGRLISCAECHAGMAGESRTGDHAPPAMAACVSCHDDSARTPPDRRMRACETCHATRQASIGSIAPRSHLPALERPEDHTRAFRRDHAADAAARPQQCARCHTFMSGSARDTCNDCHGTMRPQDHTVTWREFNHGPAAGTRTDACATCHQVDFCTACHQFVRPRSHFPAGAFRAGGHGMLARVNPRSCLTCHVPDQQCADCHMPRLR
jgi:hypothetical protein